MMNSIWRENTKLPEFPQLDESVNTDVLIIGGGLAGILCAFMLKKAGVDCVLCEAGRIFGGTSGSTTAKITAQHGLVYHKLLKKFGMEKAQMYLKANEAALMMYRSLCQNIPCDFQEKDNYVYSVDDPEKPEAEAAALEKIGYSPLYTEKLPLYFNTAGAVGFGKQAQFDPVKFVSEIVKGLNVYENTRITSYNGTSFQAGKAEIRAKKTVVATHFPILNKHGGYFLKMYQHRSYIIAFENAQTLRAMYVDDDKKGLSFSNHNDLLLLGGGAHRTGKKGGNWGELREFAMLAYPEAQEVCRWAAQDCMTLDDVPYIGRYSPNTPDIFVATGFNKWGMTSSMVSAMMLTDMVQGKESIYETLFSPSRSVLHPQLAVNAFETVVNLLTPTKPRCPHLGCALKWNKFERSWDCSCHGSRFDEGGTLLNNPSNGDLKI